MSSARDNNNEDKKRVVVLVMSVGPYEKNGTAKWLERLGAKKEDYYIVLPNEFKKYKQTYEEKSINVYLYDEKKYINEDFEFFGFKPRNCGGVGRQGIAEAVEELCPDEDVIFYQLDDDTSAMSVVNEQAKSVSITKFEYLADMVRAIDKAEKLASCKFGARTGASIPDYSYKISARKLFNNFIMRRGQTMNFVGFRALVADDCRYGFYCNLQLCTPTCSINNMVIMFTQNQGDRDDGNALIYNGDCSWKKSYSLKMQIPWGVQQKIAREKNRVLFRESLDLAKIYPPICLEENGKIVAYQRLF